MDAGGIRGRNDTMSIFETQFNNILISESNPSTQRVCANQRDYRALDVPKFKMSDAPDYPDKLRFTLIVFRACRATEIRGCDYPACIATMADLKLVIPPCSTWPGLERWALQVAACFCSGQASNLDDDMQGVWYEITYVQDTYPESAPAEMSYIGKPAAFADWAQQVNHHDRSVFMPLGFVGPRLSANGYRDKTIGQAKSRARKLHLCPHRIWAIAFSLPGRESNMPALVPYKHSLCSHKHEYCSTGPSHKNCTYDYCEISAVNFTSVVQCHRPSCGGKCQKKVFPAHFLDKVANENRPTAWAIDGELRPLDAGERYMAISHVWSDGTGGSGSVNECMYNFFCDVARKLECKGLWWDAICIPQDKHARAKAISQMHGYYSQAACTVVHDGCLAMSEWVDGNHASFGLVMSNWFTRGWTALELSRSKRVEVVFKTRERTGYVLKNLDVDIVSGPAIVSSTSRQVASTAIQSLRKSRQKEASYSLDDVLTALGPRFTSWARDRATIAGQFVGIETLANDQHSIYQQVICKIGRISSDQLFHHTACPPGPFAWLPSSLFDLPISTETGIQIQVLDDGSLLGDWSVTLLPVDFQFSWDLMHPMSICDIREALNDNRHIILSECYQTSITRGLLVKVMKDTGPSYDILCHYIGPVYFTPVPWSKPGNLADHTVLINNEGADLDAGISAVDHIKSLVPRKNCVSEFGGGDLGELLELD